MISRAEAQEQARLLLEAAELSPVRQYRYELRRRGKEWARAAKEMEARTDDGSDSECAIELVGSVSPGMKIPTVRGYGYVVRQMARDGQLSLHIEDEEGRPIYLNFCGPSSPVVVQA